MKPEPTGNDLLQRLLHEVPSDADLATLAAQASGDADLAKRIGDELAFSEMLRQALGAGICSGWRVTPGAGGRRSRPPDSKAPSMSGFCSAFR